MKLKKVGGLFVLDSTYAEREAAKAAGFRFHWPENCRNRTTCQACKARIGKGWWTADAVIASRLIDHADEETRKLLTETRAAIAESKAGESDITVPVPPGLNYLPFQKAGIAYASTRKGTLIGDEMGLGKTIQALGLVNHLGIGSVLVVCPAGLRINWLREAKKWLVAPKTYYVVENNDPIPRSADFVIVNYDRLGKQSIRLGLLERRWGLLVVDECHYCKNPDAQRSVLVLGRVNKKKGDVTGLVANADRAVFLTGTPILNKPMEIQTLAGALQPALFGNRFYFGKRYAGAYQDRWGWHFDGATHLPELQERLRATFMIRRLKADVLTELPPKRRQVIELPMNGCEDAVRAEQELYAQHEDQIRQAKAAAAMAHASGDEEEYRAAVAKLREALQVSFSEMSRARHELALAKVPAVVEHVQECLEQVEKVVVFCHHRDVAGAIAQGLGRPGVDYTIAVVTGEDEHGLRQAKVDSFQGGKDVRVFVGTIGSCGVGITLNAASLAVFAELDWVPANVTQAEDRLHRIGQVNPVLIQHLVIDGSLDARMAKTLVEKQEVIDAALDDPCDFVTPVIEPEEEKRPKSYPKPTEEQREWTRDALLRMSGRCDGARKLDGMGFNKIDAWLGHKLAETAAASTLTDGQVWLAMRILMKYRGQIGEAPGKEVETS